ncbi:hypothetical protein PIB30_067830 [Stylosanthes scabra]|uniref:Protein kinase domain-containing protein n=1 Tax=Stylosanthes scabra TaxID=79078 RepID=A0ABU6VQ29_9FABA|nr:hypothetical protein [Stylosanthes scabra]
MDYRIGCSEGNNKTGGSVLALYKDDVETVNLASKSCGTGVEVVDAVVEEEKSSGGGGGIEEALRRGFMLNWTASDCKLCSSTGGRCRFNSNGRSKASMKMGLALGLAAAVTLLLVTVTLYYTRGKKQNQKHLLVDAFLERHGHLQIKRYSYSEMKKVTNSFKKKLGEGGFGSVYKGQLKDGRHVAVKILSELKGDGEDFINEVASMSRTSHVNIIALLGFCFQDFGLANVCTRKERTVSISGTRGIAGYIAPEVFSRNFGVISHKSDVYSYGMMVLEMVGRRRNIKTEVDASSEIYFPYWIYNRLVSNQELGLQSISNVFDNEKVRKLTMVSLWCIQTNPSNRPSISKAVEMLEGRVELLQLPPKPFWYSPTASP